MWAALQPRFAELAQLDQYIVRDGDVQGNRTGFVIFAGAKGEHAAVEEWVMYHLFIGVDKVHAWTCDLVPWGYRTCS